jgi:hypothetical protein
MDMQPEVRQMTVFEIYDQTIKPLPAEERLHLARLILDDLSPDAAKFPVALPERPGEIRDQEHLEELLLAGLHSGPEIEATTEYWQQKRAALLERHAQKAQKA